MRLLRGVGADASVQEEGTDEDIFALASTADSRGRREGKKLPRGVLVDSGSSVTIADGGEAFPEFPLEESAGSKAGRSYAGAGQEKLANRGERKARLRLGGPDGRLAGVKFQDGAVRRPILSVSETAKAGNSCWFDQANPCYLPTGCPEQIEIRKIVAASANKIPLDLVNGVYQMEAWVDDNSIENDRFFGR